MKTYLIITGIGSFVALAMPPLVVIGMFLIIPELMLGLMPTAFLYGVVFALFWAIPQPGLISARAWLAGLKEPDIVPRASITLKGDILVTRPFEGRCDSLSAALLKTPGVMSVRSVGRTMFFRQPFGQSVTHGPGLGARGWIALVADLGAFTGGLRAGGDLMLQIFPCNVFVARLRQFDERC